MSKKERELLEFQVYRSTTNLYKSFLDMIEKLNHDHDQEFKKLKESLPDEYSSIIRQAEYLDIGKLNYLRKKILDSGNDTRREIIEYMQNFNINFKK